MLISVVFLFCHSSESAAQSPAAKIIRWHGQANFPTKVPPYGPFGVGQTGAHASMIEWAEWIKESTGGRLLIDWSEPGSIFPPFETDKAIGKGVIPIACSFGPTM